MDHTGHRERLRQRFRQEGLDGFSADEVLELLLTYAIPRVDTNATAHLLLREFGSLRAVLEASEEQLKQVPGIGPQAASLITLLLPLLRRYEREAASPRPRLERYETLAAYCRSLFLGVPSEQCYLLCLDAKMSLLACVCLSRGTPAEVAVHPRLAAQEVIRHHAAGAVLCHNHPAGSPEPSQADLEVTRDIGQALSAIGARLYDHVIVGGGRDFSFRNSRLL